MYLKCEAKLICYGRWNVPTMKLLNYKNAQWDIKSVKKEKEEKTTHCITLVIEIYSFELLL